MSTVSPTAEVAEERAGWTSRLASAPWPELAAPIGLVVLIVIFGLLDPTFVSGGNIEAMLQASAILVVLAVGQTFVVATAGIDLSMASVMTLGAIVLGLTLKATDNIALAIVAGILAAGAVGLLNGTIIAKGGITDFIVTLGTYNIAFAITQLYSNAQTVTDVPELMTWLGNTFSVGGSNVAYGTVLMIALYLGAWFWLRETAAGRHVYAVGNNPEATRLVGIPTERVLLGVYALAGVFYGIASLLAVSRTGVGDPNAGQTENLDAITAVVLGGTSLFGGRGVILGSLIGAVVVGMLRNGLTLMGVSSVYQVLITGILVILAVAIDQLSRKGGR